MYRKKRNTKQEKEKIVYKDLPTKNGKMERK